MAAQVRQEPAQPGVGADCRLGKLWFLIRRQAGLKTYLVAPARLFLESFFPALPCPACSAGDWQHEAALEGRLAAYVSSALGWQGLGFALPHYARAGDAAAMAAAVAAAASQGGSGEEDLFVARAALSMAAVQPPPAAPQPAAGQRQLDAAAEVAGPAYAAAAGHAAPDTPLLHFVGLFLEALRRQSEELVELLAQRYRPSLDRDPQLWQLMMKARAVHLPALAAGGMGGLLGDLFGALAAPA